ncbi:MULTISPECIES: alpha/beta fold hydrolase [Rhizobium]|uniref:alpha/beta fold hydrolase n=1 Tax=Rhizobium TaxID=379 RepID=UPI00036D8CEA|nr:MULTISPECIES: alpha/beta hydrolase [Rhizobium]MBY5473379.1 alpha/beta hydrolase [Rhizobium leguminosarum]MCB2402345.1 alpha/beta hydrolase [Rhizobium ruizarguesonis]NKK59137.1 alpha/beta fold hydrolase [Rhizobium leguminosarum bv. viciae]NKL67320.1 alpha/beta fold hydrolase [Rhizobium leguminosarum bv. viciae]NKL73240.1 alpha/beta fold hydrolase [Rhizobium leguminosarum bv. viciae]
MQAIQTADVPHLGGSQIGYRFGAEYNPALPTLVLVNSFTTSSELYRAQFSDEALMSKVNLLAIEPYGHGVTRTRSEQFTYWDSAIANLQVLEKLGIDSAFVLGTSQGGWIAVRMAILAPGKIKGIIPLGTSLDYESAASRELDCWFADDFCNPLILDLTQPVGPDWVPSDEYCDGLAESGLGVNVSDEARAFWAKKLRENYKGDEGRRRIRMCAINLRDRDGLHGRLDYVECPVLWLHGTEDLVYSIANARKEIAGFTNSKSAELKIVEGGNHFLSATNPAEVNAHTVEFISKWS